MQNSKTLAFLTACGAMLTLAALALAAEDGGSTADAGGPIVVELFTSQGCSSCPPADRLLSRLATEDRARIIPLAFHVDYWNYIGWTDPFSSEDWSDRQRRYARAFGSGRSYTPQLVVNGRSECVGSDEERVRGYLASARGNAPAGDVELGLASGDGGLRLDISARARSAAPAGSWDVMVAVFETDLVTPVKRGENGGRTLRNSNVVRSLTRAFTLDGQDRHERSESLELPLDPGWRSGNLGVAAFLQNPDTLHIDGAAVRYLADSVGRRSAH